MQFGHMVGQYHLTGADIVIAKSDFLESLVVQKPLGTKHKL